MAEYIEREMALKAIDEYFHTTNPDGEEQIGVLKSRKVIRVLPAADVEVVKHGRWLPQVLLGQRVWDCSECKTLGSPFWKRCPICEAKMDLEG